MKFIKNNIFRIIWTFFLFFILFFLLINDNSDITYNLFSFHYIVILGTFILTIFVRNPFKDIELKRLLISFFLTFLYIICSIAITFIDYLIVYVENNVFCYYLLFIISIISAFTLIYYVLNLNVKTKSANTKFCTILVGIISFVLLIIVLTTFTGLYDLMIFDAWYSFSEFKELNNWHGLGWSITVALCRIVFSTPYPIIILQLVCYIYFLKQAIFFIGNKSKYGALIFTILTLLNISLLDSVRLLLPDIMCSICMFGFVLNLIFIILDYNTSIKNYILLTFTGIIAVTFRHATFFPIMIPLIILLVKAFIKKDKKSYKSFLLPTVTIFLIKVFLLDIIIMNVFNVEKYDKVHPFTIPLYMITSLAANDVIEDDSDLEAVNNILPIDVIKLNYAKFIPDTLLRDWSIDRSYIEHINEIPSSEILLLNLKLFIKYPTKYLYEFFCMNNILWSFTDLDINMYSVHLTELYSCEAYYFFEDSDIKYPIPTYYTILAEPINKLFTKIYSIDILKPFLLRNGIYAFSIIISSIILVLKKNSKILIALFPIYVYFFLLMLSIQATATRYILPFMLVSNFILIFSIITEKTH